MIPISRSTCDPRLPKAWNAISPEETESVLKEYIHEDGRKRHILRGSAVIPADAPKCVPVPAETATVPAADT